MQLNLVIASAVGLCTDVTWQRFVTVKRAVLFCLWVVFVRHCHADVSSCVTALMWASYADALINQIYFSPFKCPTIANVYIIPVIILDSFVAPRGL